MKTSADIALAASAIAEELPLVGFPAAWSAAEAAVRALDEADRLAPTAVDEPPFCFDCHRTYTGPGRICPSCRSLEDGHERQPLDDHAFAALSATGYADDEAVF